MSNCGGVEDEVANADIVVSLYEPKMTHAAHMGLFRHLEVDCLSLESQPSRCSPLLSAMASKEDIPIPKSRQEWPVIPRADGWSAVADRQGFCSEHGTLAGVEHLQRDRGSACSPTA